MAADRKIIKPLIDTTSLTNEWDDLRIDTPYGSSLVQQPRAEAGGAPTDGSAWVDEPREEGMRIHRAGDYTSETASVLPRSATGLHVEYKSIGFRPARSIKP